MLLSFLSPLLAGESETERHKIFINLWGETKARKQRKNICRRFLWMNMRNVKRKNLWPSFCALRVEASRGEKSKKLFRAHNKVGEGKQKLYGSQKYAYLLGLISLHWALNERRAGGGWRSPAKLNTTERRALKGIFYDNIMTRRIQTYLMPNILLLHGKFLIIMQIDPLWGCDERRDSGTQHNAIEFPMMEKWLELQGANKDWWTHEVFKRLQHFSGSQISKKITIIENLNQDWSMGTNKKYAPFFSWIFL